MTLITRNDLAERHVGQYVSIDLEIKVEFDTLQTFSSFKVSNGVIHVHMNK